MIHSFNLLNKYSSDLRVDLSIINEEYKEIDESGEPMETKLNYIANICEDRKYIHPDWSKLAGRIMVVNMKKHLPKSFSKSTEELKMILNDKYYNFIINNRDILDSFIVEERDLSFNKFSLEVLTKSYLLRIQHNGKIRILETPQFLFLRVATFLWFEECGQRSTPSAPLTSKDDKDVKDENDKRLNSVLEKIKRKYDDLSTGLYIHASPTLFNSGLKKPQLASCFTMTVEDSMKGIAKSWHDSAIISKNSGGLGIDYSSIRHSDIGHIGQSNGVIPWIKIEDQILLSVDQGGKRKGSGTAYICDWHIDIELFIQMRDNEIEEHRAKNIFYAINISDLFMNRLRNNMEWTLFDPKSVKDEVPSTDSDGVRRCMGLEDYYGDVFEGKYLHFEHLINTGYFEGKYKKVKAINLARLIAKQILKMGVPFILFTDACNRKSNQQNLGKTKLSNLCTEILLYVSKHKIGSCNLASISLSKCIKSKDNGKKEVDHEKLGYLARELTENINRVIERTYYPSDIPQIKHSNMSERPLGIGVQGLADVFAQLDICWGDPDSYKVNKDIFETIYYHALHQSMLISKELSPYTSFNGSEFYGPSPISQGILQPDLWYNEKVNKYLKEGKNPEEIEKPYEGSKYDWDQLKEDIKKYGVRNSLLVAIMPTASSASILGNNECIEPYTQLMYMRTKLAGQYLIMNEYFVNDLYDIGLWNEKISSKILENNGILKGLEISDFEIKEVTKEQTERFNFLKKKYKSAFEIRPKVISDMSRDRGPYVCQTQSLNFWVNDPTENKIIQLLEYNWRNGLKTGLYYMRQNATQNPTNFALLNDKKKDKPKNVVCTDDVCISCQS